MILTGPTAVGKTRISLELAEALSGEIVSADSMQVYRGMDIGTDKLSPDRRRGIPHHLIDICDPTEDFNVYRFQRLALRAIDEIHGRGRLPILVGGTGFYIQAVLYQVAFEASEDGGACRRELELRAKETGGPEALHEALRAVDPEAAEGIHPNNVKRVIRALEYHHLTGERISRHNEVQRQRRSPFDFRYYVLTDDRARLYDRIDRRVGEMLQRGLAEEVRGLLDGGLTGRETSMQGLGYRQMLPYLRGECTLEEAAERIRTETRHFAKRQLTWFRREREVCWMDRAALSEDAAIREEILADWDQRDSKGERG